MKKLLAVLLFSLLAFSAHAEEYKIPSDKPIATADFPKGWKVENDEESLVALSSDEEIYLSIEVFESGSVESLVDESMKLLTEHKVVLDKDSLKEGKTKINEMEATSLTYTGKDEDGPTKVSIVFLAVTEEKGLLIVYWATPEADTKYTDDLNAIVSSLKKAE